MNKPMTFEQTIALELGTLMVEVRRLEFLLAAEKAKNAEQAQSTPILRDEVYERAHS